jgi:hypothetical protein
MKKYMIILAVLTMAACENTPESVPVVAKTQKLSLVCGDYDVRGEMTHEDTINVAINGAFKMSIHIPLKTYLLNISLLHGMSIVCHFEYMCTSL